jgi:hypothetical protein
LNIVPEPGGFNHDAVFESGDPPETCSAASTAKDSMFTCVDDHGLVHFNPRYIGTTSEMSSTVHLTEEADSIGSKKTCKKKIFLDDTVAEAAGGRITGSIFGHSGLAIAIPDVSNASTVNGYRVSCSEAQRTKNYKLFSQIL